jgi:hypothetical protein
MGEAMRVEVLDHIAYIVPGQFAGTALRGYVGGERYFLDDPDALEQWAGEECAKCEPWGGVLLCSCLL